MNQNTIDDGAGITSFGPSMPIPEHGHPYIWMLLCFLSLAIAVLTFIYILANGFDAMRIGRRTKEHLGLWILALACICMSGCLSPSQQSKLNSAVSSYSGAVNTLSAENSKTQAVVTSGFISTTGTVPKSVANDLSYANSTVQAAQASVTLLQGIAALLTTSGTPATATAYSGRFWTPKGIAMIRHYHIQPRDPLAVRKLIACMDRRTTSGS